MMLWQTSRYRFLLCFLQARDFFSTITGSSSCQCWPWSIRPPSHHCHQNPLENLWTLADHLSLAWSYSHSSNEQLVWTLILSKPMHKHQKNHTRLYDRYKRDHHILCTMPCRDLQIVQWQIAITIGSALTSNSTAPQKHCPVYFVIFTSSLFF